MVLKSVAIAVEQGDGADVQQADDILAVILEWGETDTANETFRKDFPGKYGGDKQRSNSQEQEKGNMREDPARLRQEYKRCQQGNAFKEPGTDPELVGIIVLVGKDRHALVGEGMQQIEKADD